MPLTPTLQRALDATYARKPQAKKAEQNRARRGEAIFAGTDYPRTWDGFVGQADAVAHLRAHLDSCRERDAVRLDHILLASGLHGIGKTTLAKLIAANTKTLVTPDGSTPALIEVSGPVEVGEARAIFVELDDGDILFWDEIHLAVSGGKAKAEWLLPYLTDGVLMTATGAEEMPNVTIVGATTDLGRLPQTIISRFMVRPHLTHYTEVEALQLVGNLARRMGVWIPDDMAPAIAEAANRNPRNMRAILTAVRDLPPGREHDLDLALKWSGFARDGLSTVAVEMLLVLLATSNHTASIDTIQAQLGEPGTLRHHEQTLLQRGYVNITGRGRVLTEAGKARAIEAL